MASGGTMTGDWGMLVRALRRASRPIALVRGPDFVYELANDLYCKLAGIEGNPTGKSFGRSSRTVVRDYIRPILERVYASGQTHVETEFPLASGSSGQHSYLNIAFEPTFDESGAIDGIFIHSTDVTEQVVARKAAEAQQEALRVAENRLKNVVSNAPIILWAVDADGITTLSEGRGLYPIGLSPGQAVGLSAFEMYKDYPLLNENLRRGLNGEEFTVTVPVGDVWYETIHLPQRDAQGRVCGLMGVSIDITTRKQAEAQHEKLKAQILQVQKLESLGVLAGGIAHDFNNLLTVILGGASAAALNLAPESPAQAPLDDVVKTARRASDLTRQLLAYSGKGHFDVRPLDLSALVRELTRLLEASISKRVQVRLELAGNLPAIEADVGQMQQIVMNLVINGAEAIGDHNGTILITTAEHDIDERYGETLFAPGEVTPGRYVYLEVHDTGSGMDEATKAKIFDPFFTTKFTGRGLGLAAVLGIVRAHRGAIRVYSTPGSGSTFKLFFPASAKAAVTTRSGEMDSICGSGLVLVVDDDTGVRRCVRQLLELFGFTVIEAANGREGVAAFEKHAQELRLVILDMTMPEMSGEETFRELRRIRDAVPVVLSSGYNEIEATRRFVSKGLAGFLQKPFASKELARCISVALGGGERAGLKHR